MLPYNVSPTFPHSCYRNLFQTPHYSYLAISPLQTHVTHNSSVSSSKAILLISLPAQKLCITSQCLLNKVKKGTYLSSPITHYLKASKTPRFSETGFVFANTLPDTISQHLSKSPQASLGFNTQRLECENWDFRKVQWYNYDTWTSSTTEWGNHWRLLKQRNIMIKSAFQTFNSSKKSIENISGKGDRKCY